MSEGQPLTGQQGWVDADTAQQLAADLRRYGRQDAGSQAALRRLTELRPGERPDSGMLLDLASGHVSTAERLPGLAEFHAALFDAIGAPRSVLDVGCGIYPVQFPFDEQGAPVASYVAADKDPASLAVLRALLRFASDAGLAVLSHFAVGQEHLVVARR